VSAAPGCSSTGRNSKRRPEGLGTPSIEQLIFDIEPWYGEDVESEFQSHQLLTAKQRRDAGLNEGSWSKVPLPHTRNAFRGEFIRIVQSVVKFD
jgi:hypothetical protein